MSTSFTIISKPTGPICNLDCQYCFYLEKETLYPHEQKWAMSKTVLEKYVQQYIEAQAGEAVNFVWQGGEPTLLGVDFFKAAVELQHKFSNGKKIGNALQTNGVLLDAAWCEFFAENNFLIGISIDGPQRLHDKYRTNKGGKPTFDAVINAIELLKKHHVEFNTLTVVHRENSHHALEVYHFLKSIGARYLQFIPLVERKALAENAQLKLISVDDPSPAEVTEWSVAPAQYGNFLCEIFDEWIRNDVGRYFIQSFDVALESWYGAAPSLCVFAETCGDALALEHNGDLYSCDHYVYPENKLGNILQQPMGSLVLSEQQKTFGRDKKDRLPEMCRRCEVRFACNGGCPKHRFTTTPSGESGLNYFCEGYLKFFRHVSPYMRFMANELKQRRPPANVMQWADARDRGFPDLKVGRNDPCPCGSGEKFKKCCGAN